MKTAQPRKSPITQEGVAEAKRERALAQERRSLKLQRSRKRLADKDEAETSGAAADDDASASPLKPWSERRSLKMQRSIKRLTLGSEAMADKIFADSEKEKEKEKEKETAPSDEDESLDPAGDQSIRRKTLLSEAEDFLLNLGLRAPGQDYAGHEHSDTDSDTSSDDDHH